MKNTIKTELAQYILDKINDGILTTENRDEWHYKSFNEDYYIIGYFQGSEWLKKHDLDSFEAIDIVKQYELGNFDEFTTEINSEAIVNMIAYIYGEELLNSFNVDTVEELEKELKEII